MVEEAVGSSSSKQVQNPCLACSFFFFLAIPARCHLSHRGIKVSNLCPVCLYGLEDTTQALWSCQKAREVWQSTTLWPILKLFPGGPFGALCMFLAAECSLEDVNVFCTIAWCLWQKRNKVVFEGCKITAGEIVT